MGRDARPGFEALVLLALYIGLRRSLPRWRDPLVARLLGPASCLAGGGAAA